MKISGRGKRGNNFVAPLLFFIFRFSIFKVRIGGLEPPLLSEPDPKSDAATNYAISAKGEKSCKDTHFFSIGDENFNFQFSIFNFLVGISRHNKQGLR